MMRKGAKKKSRALKLNFGAFFLGGFLTGILLRPKLTFLGAKAKISFVSNELQKSRIFVFLNIFKTRELLRNDNLFE